MRTFIPGNLLKQVGVLALCYLTCASLNAEEYDFNSKVEFLEVYRPVAEKYRNLRSMSLAAEVTESKNGTRMPRRQIRVFVRDKYLRVDDESEDGVQVSRIASLEQSFRAIRETSNVPFQIEFANESLEEMHSSCRIASPIVSPYYHFLETPVAEFLTRTEVELESSQNVINENGERVVEIAVSRVVLGESGEFTKWFYQFCFLPDKRWVLSGYHVGSSVEVRFFHESGPDEEPLISKVEVEEKVADDYRHTTTHNVTNIDWTPPRLSEFTPSAFYSGHFNGGERRNTVVVLLAAVVLIVLVMVFRRRVAKTLY
jgi:hypothetical protein